MNKQKLTVCLVSLWGLLHAVAFQPALRKTQYLSIRFAKKNGKQGSTSKGFGKVTESLEIETPKVSSNEQSVRNSDVGLQSVESRGSSERPAIYSPFPDIELDPSLPPEERAKQLLAQKYGLRTLEEQQREAKLLEKKQEMMNKQAAWKKATEAEEFDIMAALPTPVLVGIDRFLKIGLAVTTVVFVLAGLGITAEAWQASSGNALPADIDNFIVNVVEPNFTLGLGVLLGFSISLGVFATAQLGSASSVYRQDK